MGDALGKLIDRWQKIGLAASSERYRAEAPRTLRRVFKTRLAQPAAALTKPMMVSTLDALTESGAPIMAARAMQYGRACFAWAMERGSVADNPFAGIKAAKADERERVLDDQELKAVLAKVDPRDVFGALVWVLALTGQRRGEVAGMTRDELNASLTTWTIPGARAKNGRTHDVPLSDSVREIIAQRLAAAPHCRYVFSKPDEIAPYRAFYFGKAKLDQASGVTKWTLHDLRRTCATNLQKLGVRLEVTEAVLNVSGSRRGIVGVYQKYTWDAEKRAALDAWAVRLVEIVDGRAAPSNVVTLGEARR
jgi:integrase